MEEVMFTTIRDIEKKIGRLHKLHTDLLKKELLQAVEQKPLSFLGKLAEEVLSNLILDASFERLGRSLCVSNSEINGLVFHRTLKKAVFYYRVKDSRRLLGCAALEAVTGSMKNHRSPMAILITNARVSSRVEGCDKHLPDDLILIDGPRLTEYMIEFNIGVRDDGPYKIKKIDQYYFG
jgi:restriction system protein